MSRTILLVDDEPLVTEALKRALRKEPYLVLNARSAAEALRILEKHPVDVVVSDERMPGMTGSEFLAVVCRKYPETMRIILTGHADLESALRAINEGHVYRFLRKPCNEAELIHTLRQAVQQKDLASGSRRLLHAFRKQQSELNALEKEHPGIRTVKRDERGAIVLEEEEDYDLDTLIEEIEREVRQDETRPLPPR